MNATSGDIIKIFKIHTSTDDYNCEEIYMDSLSRVYVQISTIPTLFYQDLHMFDLTSATPLVPKVSKIMRTSNIQRFYENLDGTYLYTYATKNSTNHLVNKWKISPSNLLKVNAIAFTRPGQLSLIGE